MTFLKSKWKYNFIDFVKVSRQQQVNENALIKAKDLCDA